MTGAITADSGKLEIVAAVAVAVAVAVAPNSAADMGNIRRSHARGAEHRDGEPKSPPTAAPEATRERARGRQPLEHNQDTSHAHKRPIPPQLRMFTGKFTLAKTGTPPIPSVLLT